MSYNYSAAVREKRAARRNAIKIAVFVTLYVIIFASAMILAHNFSHANPSAARSIGIGILVYYLIEINSDRCKGR